MASKWEKAISDYEAAKRAYGEWEAEFYGWGGAGRAWDKTTKDNPNYARNLENYKKGKAKGDKLKAEVDKYSKQIKDAEAEKQKESNVQKATDEQAKAQKALEVDAENLQKAKDVNDAEAIKVAQAKVNADTEKLNAAKQAAATANAPAGTKPQVSKMPSGATGDNSQYTLATDTNNNTVYGADAKGNSVYFVTNVAPVPGSSASTVPYKDINQARNAVIKSAVAVPGGINKLKKQLLQSGFINQKEFNDGEFLKGLNDALAAHSYYNIEQLQQGKKSFIDLSSFLDFRKVNNNSSKTSSDTRVDFTTRGDAEKEANQYINEWLGRNATKQESEQYFKDLHAAEQKAIVSTTTTTDGSGHSSTVSSGNYLTPADHVIIAGNLVKPFLNDANFDKVVSGGGKAAQGIKDLQKFAAEYGVTLNPSTALSYIKDSLTAGSSIDKQKQRIIQTATAIHPYLKEHFANGGTYLDIAKQYSNMDVNILGSPDTDETALSPRIKEAISKGLNPTQYGQQYVYSDPKYRNTPDAHAKATDFLTAFGNMIGVM